MKKKKKEEEEGALRYGTRNNYRWNTRAKKSFFISCRSVAREVAHEDTLQHSWVSIVSVSLQTVL